MMYPAPWSTPPWLWGRLVLNSGLVVTIAHVFDPSTGAVEVNYSTDGKPTLADVIETRAVLRTVLDYRRLFGWGGPYQVIGGGVVNE